MATNDIHPPQTMAPPALAPPAGSGGGAAASSSQGTFKPFGEDGFTFADFLDIVNPLQHIPIVSTLYRQITGDTIDPASRLAGGTLFGGAIGAAIAMANVAIEDATGKDVGGQVIALFSGDATEPPAIAVASETIDPANAPATGAAAPIPDLALLGPLPLPSPADTPALAADMPPTVPAATPPMVDLAALAPLAPMATPPPPSLGATVAALGAPSANPLDAQEQVPPMAGRSATPIPPGGLATEGGWFTQTMLSALEKYHTAARLDAAGPETAALTVSN